MSGPPETPPGDGDEVDELLQAPLSYPDLEDYPTDLLSPPGGSLLAFNDKKGAKSKKRKGPRKTQEMQVELKDLGGVIFVGANQSTGGATGPLLVPRGNPITAHGKISYHDKSGQEVQWKANRIKYLFRGKTEFGPGPHTFAADAIGDFTLVVKVEIWSDKRRRWVSTTFHKQAVRVYCPVDVVSLSADAKLLACTIFSEGGSNPKVDRKELVAIAWTVRNRLELLKKTEADAAANATSVNKRKKKYVFSIFGATADYAGVLTKARYSGIGTTQFQQCEKPVANITTNTACNRLQLSVDVAKAVMSGTEADPFAGLGNTNAPGAFFYMTKDLYKQREKQVKAGNRTRAGFHSGKKLPALGTGDFHFFWGMNPSSQLPYSDPSYVE